MWGIGSHGAWCNTRTWPTQCPTCGVDVYFFMCDCGSKVFFDDLGTPWPIHDCDTSWTRTLKRTTDKTGRIDVELSPGVIISRPPDTFEIDGMILDRARSRNRRERIDPIVSREPGSEQTVQVVGVLREIRRSVRPIKTYRLDDTLMGHALLGPIGTQAVGKVTIHAPHPTEEQLESFTAWIPSELLADARIKRGITVAVGLDRVDIPGRVATWFCDCFEVVG